MRITLAASLAALSVLTAPAAHAADRTPLWEVSGLKEPESVLPHAEANVLYVSQVAGDFRAKDGVGFIAKVSPDGKLIDAEWIKGLNAPKGLARVEGRLFVADIDELVEIDIAKGEVTTRHKAEGAVFLNDAVAAPDGRVFVSDTATNTLWVLADGRFSPWLSHEGLKGPNGLLVENGRLVVAAIGRLPKDGDGGAPANLVAVNLGSKAVSDLGDGRPVGFLDGLAALGGGAYLASDYGRGPVYRIASDGSFAIVASFPPGTADLAYDAGKGVAYVPQSKEGKLTALRLP
ncbi:SMP-30/gluconolactonase/LRE family protein [Methylopila musalis]|uniref:SMP-30/gluconolactonase/LRE family protein n=1 Tax=Methylopila musalis TaxID=1134781 RepID=A0ABW3Z7K3_9HYPH